MTHHIAKPDGGNGGLAVEGSVGKIEPRENSQPPAVNQAPEPKADRSSSLVTSKTPLPTRYLEAKAALKNCERVDECKSWSDKAAALRAYGKQMKDRSLEDMAQRIRDRAIQRGGELLLKEQERRKGVARVKGAQVPGTKKVAAEAAGLTPAEAKTMIRVANVPKGQFESMVEADKPATVKQLAEAGKKPSPRPKPEPYRNEWIDWTGAINHCSSLPACGLEVLVDRRANERQVLIAETTAAIENINLWLGLLAALKVAPAVPEIVEPEAEPALPFGGLVSAWHKATNAQRHLFVRTYERDIRPLLDEVLPQEPAEDDGLDLPPILRRKPNGVAP